MSTIPQLKTRIDKIATAARATIPGVQHTSLFNLALFSPEERIIMQELLSRIETRIEFSSTGHFQAWKFTVAELEEMYPWVLESEERAARPAALS